MIITGNIYAGLSSGGGGGGVTTLSNGLTLVGTNGVLGGTLVQDTIITQAGNLIDFNGNNVTLVLDDAGTTVYAFAGVAPPNGFWAIGPGG